MLGRLEMSIDECILAYTQLINSVFGEKVNNIPVDWSGKIRPQYDSQRLKAAIENVIEKAGAAPDDLMDDGAHRHCRVFVCTTAKDTLQITRLRSYPVPNEDTLPATICEAALATSAATGYFESATIGTRQFVDGAFGANNPVEEVEEEAADIWCTTTRDLKPLVKCFLSVGTGCPLKMSIDDNMIKFLSKTLVRMATKPESTGRRFMARWSDELRQKRIFRFNVDQGLQGVHMTEYQKRSLIESATHDYLHHSTQKDRIRQCILNLAGKEGMWLAYYFSSSRRDAKEVLGKTDLEFDMTMRVSKLFTPGGMESKLIYRFRNTKPEPSKCKSSRLCSPQRIHFYLKDPLAGLSLSTETPGLSIENSSGNSNEDSSPRIIQTELASSALAVLVKLSSLWSWHTR